MRDRAEPAWRSRAGWGPARSRHANLAPNSALDLHPTVAGVLYQRGGRGRAGSLVPAIPRLWIGSEEDCRLDGIARPAIGTTLDAGRKDQDLARLHGQVREFGVHKLDAQLALKQEDQINHLLGEPLRIDSLILLPNPHRLDPLVGVDHANHTVRRVSSVACLSVQNVKYPWMVNRWRHAFLSPFGRISSGARTGRCVITTVLFLVEAHVR